MDVFGIMGFFFGLVAFTQVMSLKKEVKDLKNRFQGSTSLKDSE